jgi:hypothetical protein
MARRGRIGEARQGEQEQTLGCVLLKNSYRRNCTLRRKRRGIQRNGEHGYFDTRDRKDK